MQPPESIPTPEPSNGHFTADHSAGADHERVPTDVAPQTGALISIAAFALAVVLCVAFGIVRHHRAAAENALADQTRADANTLPIVDVVNAKLAAASQPLNLPGQARAWYESTIYARVSGYVGNWTADIGDNVKKGQVLALIDTPDLDDQLIAATAKVNASDAEINVAKANSDLAKSTYDRYWQSPKGDVSEQEKEEKKAEFDSSVAKLTVAQAQSKLDQADVERLRTLTQFKQVTAPFDGIVTGRRIDIGDLVTAGSTASTTSLYTVAQADRIRVFVDVPQNASADIHTGMPAVTSSDELPGRKFEGVVARTARAIDPVSRTLRVEVDIANPDLALMPGMYVQVNFQVKTAPAPQVPASAMVFRSSGAQVAVVGPDDRVHFHSVTIAQDRGDFVQISSGLQADDKVALNISNTIADGDAVQVVDLEKNNLTTQPSAVH